MTEKDLDISGELKKKPTEVVRLIDFRALGSRVREHI